MKKIFIALTILFCIQAANAFAPKILVVNADKMYTVDMTVDTTLSLHNINPKEKSKKAYVRHKVHCDFKVIYQWEDDFLYRMVVKKSYKIAKEKITQYNTNFPFCIYLPDANDSCSCNYYDDSYFFGIVSHSALYMPSKLGLLKVGFTEKDSVTLYSLYDLQILRCSYINKIDRFYYNFHCININDKSYINYYKSKTTEDQIKNYIYKSIFYNSKIKKGFYSCFLFPDSLPVEYGKAKTFSYNKSCDGNCIVSSNKVYNISGKAMYGITNNNTFNHPADENKKVNIKYDFLYIPHVMYMPLGGFKYKIKSINGQPLKQFMAGYVDDFKPTPIIGQANENSIHVGKLINK
jgi:hypothetical protein